MLSTRSDKPDVRALHSAVKIIAETARNLLIIVIKSTAFVGTAELVAETLTRNGHNGYSFTEVSNLEYLREGAAVYDFFNPPRGRHLI